MNATQTPAATGTLARKGVAMYLYVAESAQAKADRLHAMFIRMDDTADCDAIWFGSRALLDKRDRYITELRDRSGLLFFGSCAATAIAKQMGEAA